MIRFAFFQALKPDADFPALPFSVKLNRTCFHFPIPALVRDFIVDLLSEAPFERLEDYCSPIGIEILRTQPRAFGSDENSRTYAVAESQRTADGASMTVVEVAVSRSAAISIVRHAIEGQIPDLEVSSWIARNGLFLKSSGGFLLTYLCYSLDPEVGGEAAVGNDETQYPTQDDLAETSPRFGMFRQMLQTTGLQT